MKRLLCALVIAGLAASANAEDLDLGSVKDPLPGTLSWHGVTIYGTIDVDYAYQTNGRPNGSIVSDLEYTPFMPTHNYTNQSISTITANAIQQSYIGIKAEEAIGYGFTAVGKLETGFNPITGELSDGCSSFVQNLGLGYNQMSSTADSGRCGQAFNGVSYAGVSNPAYGTLTVGRQQSFQLDTLAVYDPMALAYAFSIFAYSGTGAGSGSTEAARWDNSVKYVLEYGPVHAGAMFSDGGEATGMFGTGYGFDVGGSWQGVSIDAVYTREHGAVNLLSVKDDTFPYPDNPLEAAISNDEGWSVMGKYTYDFGAGGFKDGCGLKDGDCVGAKLAFFGGYEHVSVSNSNAVADQIAATTAGGYLIAPQADYYYTPKVLQFAWTGAKYELPSGWSFTAAYYYINQGSFISGTPGNQDVCTNGGATRIECAGTYGQVSALIDYQFNKHFDVYIGATYAIAYDGLAAGFPGTPCGSANHAGGCYTTATYTQVSGNATSIDSAAAVTGLRLRF
ncbi:MAG: porin [Rhodomicrobium sp.]